MIVFGKLWLYLQNKGMKRTDLLNVISRGTLAKLGKNESVTTEVIAKICEYLDCQPADIMENMSEEQMQDIQTKLNNAEHQLEEYQNQLAKLAKQFGMTEELYKKIVDDGGSAIFNTIIEKLGLPKPEEL